MVTFSVGATRFTYRVAAVVVREGHVLLMRNLAEDYWFTPGSRVELGKQRKPLSRGNLQKRSERPDESSGCSGLTKTSSDWVTPLITNSRYIFSRLFWMRRTAILR
jgi:hypothetical protein